MSTKITTAQVDTQELIKIECDLIKEMLLAKNRSYGDSAIRPISMFARGLSSESQIRVRIDDKLNRIIQGNKADDEDVIQDLIGYLILLRIARKIKQ